MRIVLILIIAGCLSQLVSAQPLYKDLKESGLIGHVKSVIEYTYYGKTNADKVNMDQTPSKTIMNFDQNGRKVDETRLTYQGILMGKFTFDYSDPKRIVINEYQDEGKLTKRYAFKYDNSGRIAAFYQYYPKIDSPIFSILYKYDDKNNLIEDSSYVAGKHLVSKNKFLYNERNQKIEADIYSPPERSMNKIHYKYSQNGALAGQNNEFEESALVKNNDSTEYSNPDKYGNFQSGLYINRSSLLGQEMVGKKVLKRVIVYYP